MLSLRISEIFYSVQGEGPTAGMPCVFVRLGGCNLLCGGAGTQLDKELYDGATWRCDTIETWMQATTYACEEVFHIIDSLRHEVCTRVVITGGEPLIQADGVVELIGMIRAEWEPYHIEVETNGTLNPDALFYKDIRFNVSPKLSNSGMPADKRINPDAINRLLQRHDSVFKFVVSSASDVKEALSTYIGPLNIPRARVWLMPACSTRAEFIEASEVVVEHAKRFAFNFSPRLQLAIWDKTVGV